MGKTVQDVINEREDKEKQLGELKNNNEILEGRNQELLTKIDTLAGEVQDLYYENKQLKRNDEKVKDTDVLRLIDRYSKLKGITNILYHYAFDDNVMPQDLIRKGHEEILKDFEMR